MDAKYYKWKDLVSTVRTLLTVDKDRIGIQDADDGAPGYISLMIRQAVIDLQNYIPAYRISHETLYYPQDFAPHGKASRGVLPPLAKLRDMWMFNYATNARYPVLHNFPWERRFEMVAGIVPLPDQNGRVAIDPESYTFYAYPEISDQMALSVFWDGTKTDFQDNEETPFDEQSTLAIAQYVKGNIARDVENDLNKFNSYFNTSPMLEGTYIKTRKKLFLSAKERTR